MPHMGWEARRDGIDDYRYLQMVDDLVAAKPTDSTAVEAGTWLQALRARLIRTTVHPRDVEAGVPLDIVEYEEIRQQAADYIIRLSPLPIVVDAPQTRGLKDEALPFRGRSVNDCIQGLGSAQDAIRRAAAWALVELGQEAAPATVALTCLLTDEEVRMPALHALETIGPEAYPAADDIAALLSHHDPFVRQGATFALGGIARPQNWDEDVHAYAVEDISPYAHTVVMPLKQALHDPHEDVRWIAAFGLSRCGQAAAPALPDAIRMVSGTNTDLRAAGLRVLCGMGPAAADAVPLLTEQYLAAKAEDRNVTWTLASIGHGASAAIESLVRFQTIENPYLADTCYALCCIGQKESDLRMLAELLGDERCPRGVSEWEDVARFLIALGSRAEKVAPLVRRKLLLLDDHVELKKQLETEFLSGVSQGARPLRLLPR